MLCGDLNGKEMSNGVDIYTGTTASLCCTAETNILKQLYSNKNSLKINLKKGLLLQIPEARGLSELGREQAFSPGHNLAG